MVERFVDHSWDDVRCTAVAQTALSMSAIDVLNSGSVIRTVLKSSSDSPVLYCKSAFGIGRIKADDASTDLTEEFLSHKCWMLDPKYNEGACSGICLERYCAPVLEIGFNDAVRSLSVPLET